jgi:dolichol kinase
MPHLLRTEEILRKALHLLALAIPFGIYYVPREYAVIILPSLTAAFLTAEALRLKTVFFGRWATRAFGPFMRDRESKSLTGAAYMFIAGTIALLLFPKNVAFIALSFVFLGDAAAALVGIPYGRIRVGKKSVEGTLACFASCLVLWCLFPRVPIGQGMLCAILTSLLELLPLPIDDNLLVPLVTGSVLAMISLGK